MSPGGPTGRSTQVKGPILATFILVDISRKPLTGSKPDVLFDDLGSAYPFGVTDFNDAQVRHACVQKPVTLVFQTQRAAGRPGSGTVPSPCGSG